jgi:excisionase family DNA binding protein
MEIQTQPPALLTVHDAAKFLGCTTHAIRRLIKDSKLPFVHLGKRFLLDPTDLLKLVREGKQMRRILGSQS